MRSRIERLAFALTALSSVVACDRPPVRPERELLVITGDSTFWVTATGDVRNARGVPMLVARPGGRFTELYVTDDDRSYYDAVFIGHRLFARDLVRGDSVELHRDTVVARLAADFARAHPDEQPLAPDEPENESASIRVISDIEILGVHGAYLSFEHHTDVEMQGDGDAEHRHQYRRGVLDARDARSATLEQLFGRPAADSVARAGEREWRTMRDAVVARGGNAFAEERLRRAVAEFEFDPTSFAIGSDGQLPTVRFAPPARSVNPDIEPIELPAHPIATPSWWREAAAELPLADGDSARWAQGTDTLIARVASGSRGWTLSLRIGGGEERVIRRVSSAVERVIWLDSTVSDDDRAALSMAFDEAAEYDGVRQIAAAPRAAPRLAASPSTVHLARHAHFESRSTGQRIPARNLGAHDAARRERTGACLWRRAPGDARQDSGRLRHAARTEALCHGVH